MKKMTFNQLIGCFVFVLIPLAIFGSITSPGSLGSADQEDDGWQVRNVGGMAMDEKNSNVYLTSSAILKDNNAASAETRCLIRMLSFSPEEGFASVTNSTAFPNGGTAFLENEDLVCPGDPRCIVRRQLLENFQQVDETVYQETCSKIYINSNRIFVLGSLPQDESSSLSGDSRGSVVVMTLDASKIGGNETQEFRPQEEPLAAAFSGDNIIYLVSHSQSHPSSIVLYRYSNDATGLSWKRNYRFRHSLVSTDDYRIHIASLNVILGGQYLVVAGTISPDSSHNVGHFGIYYARDGSYVQNLQVASVPATRDQRYTIECICLDEQQSDASVAILYRVSTLVMNDQTVSIVNKIQLQKDEQGSSGSHQTLRQSTIWTKEISDSSMKKCQVANDTLVLAGFLHMDDADDSEPRLVVSKRSTTNGEILWTAQQTNADTNSTIRLADVAMDSQRNVLVYGKVDEKDGDNDDIVLLQALHGTSGITLASSNSPPMVVRKRISSGAKSIRHQPRSNNIVSREELRSSYQVPFIILIVGLAVFLILCICMACAHRAHAQERERMAQQKRIMNIFKYLRPFEANQVDIQQSPTGGFIATYTDELVKQEESEAETETSLSTRL